jgi:hypothetical protein
MPLTHKKKFKNRNYKNGSDITTKFKQKRRNVKSMMNQIIGGTGEKALAPLYRANSNAGYASSSELENYDNSELGNSFVRNLNTIPEKLPVVPENTSDAIENSPVVGANTMLVKSNLKSNPFYDKKSTHIVENKKMYNYDTNYIMDEIKKSQLVDPSFMPTTEFITKILAEKPKPLYLSDVDHKKQAELHRALCDFD